MHPSRIGNPCIDPQAMVVDHLLGQEDTRNLVRIPELLEVGKRVEVDEGEDL